MDASSRSFGRFASSRCDRPTALRPMRVRAHPGARRELAKQITAGWGNPSAGGGGPMNSSLKTNRTLGGGRVAKEISPCILRVD
jgi:hypothetical protein